ncbi:MAG: anti-sigma factor family protein [Acidobacteriaceae bacterium]
MSDSSQFGARKPSPSAGTLDCTAVEAWLAEAAEGNLPSGIAEQMRVHAASCPGCQNKLTQARRGRDWLLVLKQEPVEPPADLMARILARTSGSGMPLSAFVVDAPPATERSERSSSASARGSQVQHEPAGTLGTGRSKSVAPVLAWQTSTVPAAAAIPAWQGSSVSAMRNRLLEPRLALVAAMAFFSVSLTLNLMGVHLTKVRASDLQPQNLRRAVTRQYAEANAHIARYYENLRIVYEVESRVQQLRRAAETAPSAPQSGKRQGGSSDSSHGPDRLRNSRQQGMAGDSLDKQAAPPDPVPVATGPKMDVALPVPQISQIWPGAARRSSRWMGDSTSPAKFIPFLLSFALQPAPRASPCSLRTACYSMRERRFA